LSEKVLYISPNGYLGGAERFVLNACIGHQASGKFIPHILFFNDGEFVEIAKNKGIVCHVLKNKFKLSSPFKLLKATSEINQLLKEIQPKVINTTMPYSQIVLNLARKSKETVTIWFQHGPVGGTLDRLCAYLPCEHLFFNSMYLKEEHYSTSNQQVPKFGDSIISLGVEKQPADSNLSSKIREEHLSNSEEFLIISAGRICDWKGYHNTLTALKIMQNRNESAFKKIRFLLIGEAKRESDQEYLNSLKSQAEELSGQVKFLGFKNNIKDFYKAADLFIHSSTIPEPFGLVVAEAMAQGTIVIGGNVGGVTDILRSNETGFSFSAHTEKAPEELAGIIESIVSGKISKEKRETIKENAKGLIHEKYSVEAMTQQLEEKYNELISLKRKF
jgi:glycosyltransferase involved in cell wall biosynthesis